jgi:peptidoglycan/LPS O-acetylase OafA/YrhL
MFHSYSSFDSVTLEWIAFIGMVFASTVGSIPMLEDHYSANLAAAMLMRSLLGLTLVFLVNIMLSKEDLAWYRPARYLRLFLSWDIWSPIANLSYSIYLTHIIILVYGEPGINLFKSEEEIKV